jgi:hypothetical protein
MWQGNIRNFFLYITCQFFFVLIGNYFFYIAQSQTYYILSARFFYSVEIIFIPLIFLPNFSSIVIRRISVLLSAILFVYSIFDFVSSFNNTEFNFLIVVLECILLLINILFFFYEKMRSESIIPLYQTTFFWIAIAFFIYSTGNFFLFIFSSNSVQDESFSFQYTIIYSGVEIVKNILFCIGITIKDKSLPNASPTNNTLFNNPWDTPNTNSKT